MKSAEDQILDLMNSTNATIQNVSQTVKDSSKELGNLRNDSIVFGSVMLSLVNLLVDKEIITQEEFDIERLRELARLDQELAAGESKNE